MLLSKQSADTRRKRSTHNICTEESTNHTKAEAEELGISCYTAASLSASSVENQPQFEVGDGKYYGRFHNAPLESGANYDLHMAAMALVSVSINNLNN